MYFDSIQIGRKRRTRCLRLKEAIVASFTEPAMPVRARMAEFNVRDWKRIRFWLHVSGLALYFLDRLTALDATSAIPDAILRQLQKNLADNSARTMSLLNEAVVITQALTQQGVHCALLKGVTLPPESVPDCALRVQMDLDLLIGRTDTELVRRVLARFGYALDAVSGNTWEFKAGPSDRYGIRHIYECHLGRAIDVHVISPEQESATRRLRRARRLSIHGEALPALCPVDTFVYQAEHLFKHICSDHVRASWVLEFWRHVCARRNDVTFWRELKALADQDLSVRTAIGASTLLATQLFGPFAPEELSSCSMANLPAAIGIWIQLYWRRVLLSDTPRHKLYLLLRKELSTTPNREQHARRRLIFPIHWPQRITRPSKGETTADRLRRHWIQTRFSLYRLRFHLIEGARLALELRRWQRCLSGVCQ